MQEKEEAKDFREGEREREREREGKVREKFLFLLLGKFVALRSAALQISCGKVCHVRLTRERELDRREWREREWREKKEREGVNTFSLPWSKSIKISVSAYELNYLKFIIEYIHKYFHINKMHFK